MIFGTDDRVEITATTVLPWSAVVELEITYPAGTVVASGVMIGPNDLLTVGHAVYSADLGGYATSIVASPGRSGRLDPFGVAWSISFQVDPRWVENDRFDAPVDPFSFDYALVTLDRPIGDATGFLAVGVLDDPIGVAVQAAGYPADKGYDFLYLTRGTVDGDDVDTLFFDDDLDLLSGQSGSPVFVTDPATGEAVVVGLISFDYVEPPYSNGVLRINPEYLATIEHWAATNDASAGPDWIEGGPTGERWDGLEGADTILGFGGDDSLDGNAGDDDLNGNLGDDLVHGQSGADFVRGGQGDDTVLGGSGGDWHVNGNRGQDSVMGGQGDDAVHGGPGADTLDGGAGADVISGDLGDDLLTGGQGADRFAYRTDGGLDRIRDFQPGVDQVALDRDGDGSINGMPLGSAAAVLDHLSDTADGAVLQLGEESGLLFLGVPRTALSAEDFLLT